MVKVVTSNYNLSREQYESRSSAWIGRRLRKFGLKPCRVGKDNSHGVLWDERKLQRRFERYGLSPGKPLGALGALASTLSTSVIPNGFVQIPNGSQPVEPLGETANFTLTPNRPNGSNGLPGDTPTGYGKVTYEKIGVGKITKQESDRWIDGS
jgi:hypothetical protein